MSAPSISSYEFGRMVVDGQAHERDLLLLPDRVVSGWWRREGHRLAPEDLSSVLESAPQVLVVGTGASGMMIVTDETHRALKETGIELISAPTAEAVNEYNNLRDRVCVAGAFHLTC